MPLMHHNLSTRGNEVSLNETLVECILLLTDVLLLKIYYIKN